jgi:organic hydroperoxide reductase OsmC/OhrA
MDWNVNGWQGHGRGLVTATVEADKSDAGITVVSSHLAGAVERLDGIDAFTLSELATGAEKGCSLSNAIRGNVAITVEAHAA